MVAWRMPCFVIAAGLALDSRFSGNLVSYLISAHYKFTAFSLFTASLRVSMSKDTYSAKMPLMTAYVVKCIEMLTHRLQRILPGIAQDFLSEF